MHWLGHTLGPFHELPDRVLVGADDKIADVLESRRGGQSGRATVLLAQVRHFER